MIDFKTLKKGDKIVAVKDFFTEFSYGKKQRLTAGKEYTVSSNGDLGLYIEACDMGHSCCWGTTNLDEYFTLPDAEPTVILKLPKDLYDRIVKLASDEARADDEDFNPADWSGGNFDDAHSMGVDDGYIYLARDIISRKL